MGMLKEFKEFAMRGNVVDLAIGVVIGGAFGAIVKSLVDEIVMPLIGYATGGIDFSQFKWVLKPADDSDPKHKIAEVAVQYGAFINTILTFLIIAFAVFIVIKVLNRFTRQNFGLAAAPTKDQELLAEIRDLLKTKQP